MTPSKKHYTEPWYTELSQHNAYYLAMMHGGRFPSAAQLEYRRRRCAVIMELAAFERNTSEPVYFPIRIEKPKKSAPPRNSVWCSSCSRYIRRADLDRHSGHRIVQHDEMARRDQAFAESGLKQSFDAEIKASRTRRAPAVAA